MSAVLDGGSGEVAEAVEGFLVDADRGDLLLLYFSCHGLKDESGRLYFVARNTRRNRLRSTAVPAAVVNDLLLGSRSRRKVLLLDCCYGGAFAKGMQVKADPAVHTADHFDARGLVVLTASDSTQYAFDGDVVRGAAEPSRFTSVLVSGLSSGEADLDRDGFVTVDDAYEFVRRRLSDEGVPQDPRKWEFDVAGSIVLGRSGATEHLPAAPLPPQVPATSPSIPRAGTSRVLQPIWWASSLALLAACAAITWLLVRGLTDPLTTWVKADYLSDLAGVPYHAMALAGGWAIGYALLSPPADRRAPVSWGDPWRPWVRALDAIVRPAGVRSFVRGLVSAVPVNVLLVCAGSLTTAGLGYAWGNGSESRDEFYGITFVVLAVAGLALSFVPARRP